MNAGRKIISNVFYYFLDISTVTIFGYLFWIVIGKLLVPEQYGILFTVVSLFNVIVVVTSLGLIEVLPKLIADYLKRKKNKEVNSLIKYSMKLIFSFSLIVSLFTYFFSDKISYFAYNSDKMIIPLQFLSLILFFGSLFFMYKGIMQGFQKFKNVFFADLTGNITKIVLAVLLVLVGFQALGAIIGFASWLIIVSIICSLLILKMKLKGYRNFDKKNYFRFSFLTIISLVSFFLIQQGGIIVLGVLSTFEAAALFGVAFIIGQIIIFMPIIIKGAILPNLSELWIKEKKKFNLLSLLSLKYIIIAVLPATILFSIFSEFIIKLLYSPAYLGASIILPTYLFGSLLLGINIILLIILYSANRPQIRASLLLLGNIINLILLFALIPIWGIQGAALAFLITEITILLLALSFLKKIVTLKVGRGLFLVPLSIIFFSINYLALISQSLLIKIILVVSSFIIYFFSLFIFKIINKKDLEILWYIPDKFGSLFFKRIFKKLILKFK